MVLFSVLVNNLIPWSLWARRQQDDVAVVSSSAMNLLSERAFEITLALLAKLNGEFRSERVGLENLDLFPLAPAREKWMVALLSV